MCVSKRVQCTAIVLLLIATFINLLLLQHFFQGSQGTGTRTNTGILVAYLKAPLSRLSSSKAAETENNTVSLIWTYPEAPSTTGSSNTRTRALNTHDVLKNRKICIDRIRQRHWDSLAPYFVEDDPNNNYRPSDSSTKILMVDPAHHNNFGDTLLTRGEHTFLRSLASKLYDNNNTKQARWSGTIASSVDECHYAQANVRLLGCDKWLQQRQEAQRKNNINNNNGNHAAPLSKDVLVALWQAGGNWGSLYDGVQRPRVTSFENLLKSSAVVLGMPQSLFYHSSQEGQEKKTKDAMTIKNSVALGLGLKLPLANPNSTAHEEKDNNSPNNSITVHPLDTLEGMALSQSRVVLTWREQSSYEEASAVYPFAKNVLVPDIAFQLGPFWDQEDEEDQEDGYNNNDGGKKGSSSSLWQNATSKDGLAVDILFCLRKDQESVLKLKRRGDNDKIVRPILDKHSNKTLTYRVADWTSRFSLFRNYNHGNTTTAIQMLSLGRVTICDRLHAAILCYLSGIPFVYIDQISQKVTKTFNVAFSPYHSKTVSTNLKEDNDHDCMDRRLHMWEKAEDLDGAVAKALNMISAYNL